MRCLPSAALGPVLQEQRLITTAAKMLSMKPKAVRASIARNSQSQESGDVCLLTAPYRAEPSAHALTHEIKEAVLAFYLHKTCPSPQKKDIRIIKGADGR